MSELVSNHPGREPRLIQHPRRRPPKAVRRDPVEAHAVQRPTNVAAA